ncbi:MAG: hypothetical protein NC094_02480 [Bacteroidales bacterium]|nr:hypothetical protein [Lachnoclostridium sp.]MCM1383417.1 hypothetical protein [Lachnoclostridium sp.]MCM1464264.1 hypothetical protein [Bacteroidales bacterium]
MSKCMKKMSLILCCCMVLSMLCTFSVKAASADFSYDTTSKTNIVAIYNNYNPSGVTVSVNTRPTAGVGGAKVTFETASGTIVASQKFPFQVSIPDYSVTVPFGEIWYIYIQPGVSDQRIAGVLTCSY